MDVANLSAWAMAHEWGILSFGLWVFLSVAPRPHPERYTGAARIFWLLVDRLTVLTAERAPGTWKFLFAASPLPHELAEPVPAASAVPTSAPPAAALPAAADDDKKA